MSDEKLEVEEIELTEEEKKEKEDKIQELIDSVDFEEEEVHKRWDREKEEVVEYKVPLINQFLHELKFCDHIEIKEELVIDGEVQLDEEGKPIEVVKEVKHIFWDKDAVIKDLKLKLDLDKANELVRRIKAYKHKKKKGELESKLKDLTVNNVYFLEAFGTEVIEIKGEKHGLSVGDRVAKWDKDDLEDFEDKVLKLELAKKHLDDKKEKEKPIKDRQLEYSKIDGLLLEALVEKLEEGRPEKMDKYLELRKDIKHRHPIKED